MSNLSEIFHTDGSLGELQNSNKAVYQSNKSEVYKKIKNIC